MHTSRAQAGTRRSRRWGEPLASATGLRHSAIRLAIYFELGEGIVGEVTRIGFLRKWLGRPFDVHGSGFMISLRPGMGSLGGCGHRVACLGLARILGAFVTWQRANHNVDAAAN